MKTRLLLPLLAVAAVFTGLSLKPVLNAQQPTPGDPAAGAGPFQRAGRFMLARRIFGRLHLSDEQKKAGLAVLRSHQPAIRPLVENLVRERTALRALSKASTVDEAAIRAQSARVAGIEADLAVQRAYLMHDLRAVATPEQLQTLDAMQEEGDARRAEILQRINDWIANS